MRQGAAPDSGRTVTFADWPALSERDSLRSDGYLAVREAWPLALRPLIDAEPPSASVRGP
jgi:hypothetical protein